LDCGKDDVVYQWYKVAMQPLYAVVYMIIHKWSTLYEHYIHTVVDYTTMEKPFSDSSILVVMVHV